MKARKFFFAGRLAAAVLAAAFTFGVASCGKDEDVEDVEDAWQLKGTWAHEYTDKNGDLLKDTFYFSPETSRGEYAPANGWKGAFSYSIDTPGILHLKITYYRYVTGTERQSYKSEEDWSCRIKGSLLWIDGKEYRKVSDYMSY